MQLFKFPDLHLFPLPVHVKIPPVPGFTYTQAEGWKPNEEPVAWSEEEAHPISFEVSAKGEWIQVVPSGKIYPSEENYSMGLLPIFDAGHTVFMAELHRAIEAAGLGDADKLMASFPVNNVIVRAFRWYSHGYAFGALQWLLSGNIAYTYEVYEAMLFLYISPQQDKRFRIRENIKKVVELWRKEILG